MMKIFLSGIEATSKIIFEDYYLKNNIKVDYLLTSYFYIIKNKGFWKTLNKVANEIMVDSGAHSFQKGKKVNWEDYTKQYAKFIEKNDNDKVIGYFEMDIDPAGYSYEFVKDLRKILTDKSNKIIPVWHKNRGIEDFKEMCKNPIHKDKIISITGFRNEDIKDNQYKKFFNYAKKKGCKIHCLGMTRQAILKQIPFDFVDSSSWVQKTRYGTLSEFKDGKMKDKHYKKIFDYKDLLLINFNAYVKMQKYYKRYWGKCK